MSTTARRQLGDKDGFGEQGVKVRRISSSLTSVTGFTPICTCGTVPLACIRGPERSGKGKTVGSDNGVDSVVGIGEDSIEFATTADDSTSQSCTTLACLELFEQAPNEYQEIIKEVDPMSDGILYEALKLLNEIGWPVFRTLNLPLIVNPFSPPCDLTAKIVAVSTIAELK